MTGRTEDAVSASILSPMESPAAHAEEGMMESTRPAAVLPTDADRRLDQTLRVLLASDRYTPPTPADQPRDAFRENLFSQLKQRSSALRALHASSTEGKDASSSSESTAEDRLFTFLLGQARMAPAVTLESATPEPRPEFRVALHERLRAQQRARYAPAPVERRAESSDTSKKSEKIVAIEALCPRRAASSTWRVAGGFLAGAAAAAAFTLVALPGLRVPGVSRHDDTPSFLTGTTPAETTGLPVNDNVPSHTVVAMASSAPLLPGSPDANAFLPPSVDRPVNFDTPPVPAFQVADPGRAVTVSTAASAHAASARLVNWVVDDNAPAVPDAEALAFFPAPALPERIALHAMEFSPAPDAAWEYIEQGERALHPGARWRVAEDSATSRHGFAADGGRVNALMSPGSEIECTAEGFALTRGALKILTAATEGARLPLVLDGQSISVQPGSFVEASVADPSGYAQGGAPAPKLYIGLDSLAFLKTDVGVAPLLPFHHYRVDRYRGRDVPGFAIPAGRDPMLATGPSMPSGMTGTGAMMVDQSMALTAPRARSGGAAEYRRAGDGWVAPDFTDTDTATPVRRYSRDYLDLLSKDRTVASVLASLDGPVVVASGGTFYRVEP